MSKVARGRLLGLLAVLILPVAVPSTAAAQAQPSPRSHAQGSLAQAADTTFREGVHAKLPPHLSTLLGLSKEAECPVMQGVLRTGNLVQGFDVSATNKNDIILFTVDETTNDQTLYLTSPAGILRKVVSVKAGVGDAVRITDKEKTAFEQEKQFWVSHLTPSAAAK